ncbi:MAG: hypothetical protein M3063_15690 [Actinomycetota bacterium]|nr:hypothetical protein [Actinomycetota bacterium]
MIAEAVLLILVGFFAVGLVHSYAGLLRRVQRLEGGVAPAAPQPVTPQPAGLAAPTGQVRAGADIVGETLDGEAITLAVMGVEHNTLLAFLSSGCSTCAGFWAHLPDAVRPTRVRRSRLVVVTQSPDHESLSALASLASPDVVDTVMSSPCWEDYHVPGSPYFVFVDGRSGTVRGEGTALGWNEVFDLMALAEGDAGLASGDGGRPGKPASDAEREAAVDRELLRAGIVPGDPSLYPSGTATDRGNHQ